MGTEIEPTEIFRIALQELLKSSGHTQADLARVMGIAPQRINDYLGGRINFSEHRRQQISAFFGMPYVEMLNIGYKVITGKNIGEQTHTQRNPSKPIPMDTAVQLLQEALEETGVKINQKQKEAVIKILREELKKAETDTKEDIKKYLKAFSG